MAQMLVLDLSRDVPRSPFAEVAGFPWLPRLIDKARATFANAHGDYSPYPCPADKVFLKHFGLDAAALGEVIRSGADDEAVGRWVAEHAQVEPSGFRAEQREKPKNLFWRLVVVILRARARQGMGERAKGVDWSRVDTLPKVLAAEEGHPVP